MNHVTAALCFACSLFAVGAQAQHVYLRTTFSNDDQRNYTFIDDPNPVAGSAFTNLALRQMWFPGKGVNGADGQVMYSCSHRTYDVPTDNWLITPLIEVTDADAWLTWDAQSVHHNHPESYSVLIGTDPDDPDSFREVFSTEAEDYYWQHHMLPLHDYVGQKVHVAFRHTTQGGFLLALDNVFAGQLSGKSILCTDSTAHSCGYAEPFTAPIRGTITNTGADLRITSLDCTLDDGTVISQQPEQSLLASGETRSWRFEVPVRLNAATVYRVTLTDVDGQVHRVAADSVMCTHYPRTLMLDKVTARWCLNCPSRNVEVYALEHYFGPQMVEVTTQYPDNNGEDPAQMVYSVYRNNLLVNAVPTFFYNRKKESERSLSRTIAQPCTAWIEVPQATLSADSITGDVHFRFALPYDNSRNRYRLGFALIEKKVYSPVPQANANTSQWDNEYFFLSNPLLQPLHYYANVVRGTSSAFNGITGSVPVGQLEKDKDYTYHFSIPVPDRVSNPSADNLRVVAFVLNTSIGDVLNTAYADVQAARPEGITSPSADSSRLPRFQREGTECRVHSPSGSVVRTQVLTADGRQVMVTDESSFSLRSCPAGVYVVRMQAADGATRVVKVALP